MEKEERVTTQLTSWKPTVSQMKKRKENLSLWGILPL